MKCNVCGKEIMDKSRFCRFCGAKVEEPQSVQEELQREQEEPQSVREIKKSRKKFYIVGAIAIIVIIIIIVILTSVLRKDNQSDNKVGKNINKEVSKSGKAIAYVSNGKLYYSPDMESAGKEIYISKVQELDGIDGNMLYLTKDGKYLYFARKVGKKGNVLYRAEVGKLKSDSEKNEQYIVEIDDGIDYYMVLDDETKVVYTKTDYSMNYYGNDAVTCIGEKVGDEWTVCDDGATVVYLTEDGDLLKFDSNDEEVDTIASDVLNIYESDNEDLYVYETNDGTLCWAASDGDSGEITDDFSDYIGCNIEKQTFYYTAAMDNEKNLYDYVDDPNADAEKNVTPPNKKDGLAVVTQEEMVSKFGAQFLDELNKNVSFDVGMGMECVYDKDTGEEYLYDNTANQWYLYDSNKYEELVQEYNKTLDRNYLREQLKNSSASSYIQPSSLYEYVVGEEPKCVKENVSSNVKYTDNGSILYYSVIEDGKISMDDVEHLYDVEAYVETLLENEGSAWFCYIDGNEQQMDKSIMDIEISEDAGEAIFSFKDENYSTSVAYSLENDALTEGIMLADEGTSIIGGKWIDNSYYFISETSDDTRDFMVYQNGTVENVFKEIYSNYLQMYGDNIWLGVYKEDIDEDMEEMPSNTLLTYTESGEETKISENVSDFSKVDAEKTVYLSDGTIYLYTGDGKDTVIAENVDEFACVDCDYAGI